MSEHELARLMVENIFIPYFDEHPIRFVDFRGDLRFVNAKIDEYNNVVIDMPGGNSAWTFAVWKWVMKFCGKYPVFFPMSYKDTSKLYLAFTTTTTLSTTGAFTDVRYKKFKREDYQQRLLEKKLKRSELWR